MVNINKNILLLAMLICTLVSNGQTQLGYVKTIGRPGQPSQGVQGVILRFTGGSSPVATRANGYFTVNVIGKQNGDAIRLLQIRKKGYELKDKNLLNEDMVFSTEVPLIISVVSSAQLAADKKRIEKNAYKVAERNFKKKRSILIKKIKSAQISKDKYNAELQKLQANYEKYMSLVSDMADRYARTDYDGLDSVDVEINQCIEKGDLERAEMLILSRFDPKTVIDRNRAAKKELQERLTTLQEALTKLKNDRDSILKDIDKSKGIAEQAIRIADGYRAINENTKAVNCYQMALKLYEVIYGKESEQANTLRNIIEDIKSKTLVS